MDAADTDPPPPDGRRPREGDVLNGRWRLGAVTQRSEIGELFWAKSVVNPERGTVDVWVLAPHLARNANVEPLVREAVRKSAAYHLLEMADERDFGVTYVALAVDAATVGADLTRWFHETWLALEAEVEAAAREPVAAAPPTAPGSAPVAAAAPAPLLAWLEDRRLAAAHAGVAPLGSAAPRRGSATTFAPPPAAPAPPAASATPASPRPAPPVSSAAPASSPPAPPPRARRGPHPGLWGGVAAVGALIFVSTIGLQHGLKTATPPLDASPAPTNDVAVGPVGAGPNAPDAEPSSPLRALAGAWALQGGDCDRPTRLAVIDGRLIAQGAAGPITVGSIEGIGPDGGVVVGVPQGGSTTYRVSGDTLTVTSGQHPSLVFTRCADAGAAANAASVGGEAALIAMALAGAGGAAPEAPPAARDEVDVSAFAPKRLRAGGAALVQIYLHLVEQADAAADRARAADPEAALRGQTTLGLELARGTRVDIMLDAGALGVDEPVQSLIWRGRPAACQFAVSTPADTAGGQHVLTARLLVDGVPLGRLAFTMAVDADAPAEAPELTGDDAARYTRAFLSYSSLDRPEVLKTAQTLRAIGIDFFQDILSIEPGEAWRERLFAEIDRCDLFLLFWSSHAASSDWVRQEAEYALARHRGSAEASPDIRPIILEGPPIPPPPGSLASLHFNDMLRYMVVASELEAKARGAS